MSDFPIPPPTFEFLVFSLKMQAEMRLGLMGMGMTEDDDGTPDLPAARHAIDMLAMLAEKTRGNLSIEEQRLLENSLTELRFRFVQALENPKSASASAESPAAPAPEPAAKDEGASEAGA